MPTYEYKCSKCKKTFDKLQSMNDKPLKSCIYCKGKVERLIGGGAGLIFKGTGFYITDYKNKSTPEKPGSDKPKETKTESAPAKKADKTDKK